jgi:hypothetical protein
LVFAIVDVVADLPWLSSLLLVALVVVLLWFALGTQRNIRKGNEVLEWLQRGLPRLGRRTTLRWLGSSAVELKIAEASAPFHSAELVVVLEPRDLGWLWALSRARGRRDFVILRGRLRSAPRFEAEVGDPSGWTGSDRLERLDPDAWHETEWSGGRVRVAHSDDADIEALRAHWVRLGDVVGPAWRISIRRDHPHVEVHAPLPDISAVDSASLIRAFVDLGDIAVGSG